MDGIDYLGASTSREDGFDCVVCGRLGVTPVSGISNTASSCLCAAETASP